MKTILLLLAMCITISAQVAVKTVTSLPTPCLATSNYTEIVELRAGGTTDGWYHCNSDHNGWSPMGLGGLGGGDVLKANNLSELASAATARINLGIGNINNTSDANKPISTATQSALDGKAALDLSNVNGSVDVTDRSARLLGHVIVDSPSLPSGASTEATLALIKAKTDNLDVLLSTRTKPTDTQNVSGTVTANQGGTWNVGLNAGLNAIGKLAANSGVIIGDVNVVNTPNVAITNTPTVTANAGTNTSTANLDVALSTRLKPADTLAGVTLVSAARMVGNAGGVIDAANNAAAPANVIVEGVETVAQGTQPTAATSLNVRRAIASTEGVQFVQEGNSNRFSCFVQAVTVTTQCQAAPSAGLRNYITSVHLSNQAATVQTLDVIYGTGTNCATSPIALTHKWQMGTNATTTSPQSVDASFQTPLVPATAQAICVRPSAATVFGITITGYTAP